MTDRSEQGQSFGRVIDVLEAIGALYAIWGGLAVIVYGEPRFTMDMDVLLSHHNFAAPLFIKRLQENNYHVDPITVNRVLSEGGFFNVIDLNTHIKVDFHVPRGEPYLQQAIEQRLYYPFDTTRRAAYVTPTTLIIAKLQAYVDSSSTRHLDDIASIVRVQANNLDAAAIDVAAARLKIMGLWRALWEGNYPQS